MSSYSEKMQALDVLPTILCPLCGMQFKAVNDSNMCDNCLKSQVDITEGISKQVTIFFCRGCGRYNKPPWINAELESREMLDLCLKKVKGLGKEVKLVDASFIWTEPHSRRIKLKLTVQKEVFKVILQQSFEVEFVVGNLQCEDCQRSYTEHTWTAVVQLRQKVQHKRTFFWIEQLLLKHKVCDKVQNVKEQPLGLDFYWGRKNNAASLVNFLNAVVPMRYKTAKRLISSDFSNNTQKYKHTYSVEIAPVCKDDLIMLPKKLSRSMGGIGPMLLCYKITNSVHVVDPQTLQTAEVNSVAYWRSPFDALLNNRQMIEFTVLDCERQSPNSVNPHVHTDRQKFSLAEVTCARSSDFGVNDITFTTMSHLGNVLHPGDTVVGYDLTNANLSSKGEYRMGDDDFPDVVLVRKTYPNRKNRARRRRWKLQQLSKEESTTIPRKHEQKRRDDDFEQFMMDIEEDPEMREQINIFRRNRSNSMASSVADPAEDDGFPGVPIEAMLDEMSIESKTAV